MVAAYNAVDNQFCQSFLGSGSFSFEEFLPSPIHSQPHLICMQTKTDSIAMLIDMTCSPLDVRVSLQVYGHLTRGQSSLTFACSSM